MFLRAIVAVLAAGATARAERPLPRCPYEAGAARREAARPAARTTPELFARMGEAVARDPARAFPSFLEELERLEGPALRGVRLTAAEEREVGRRAREDYLRRAAARGYPVVDDPARLRYLQELVDGLARRMKHRARYPRIDVTLIDAPVADGQSFPGGSLVFTTALLREPDEATVAAVVAHELAHLDGGHLYEYARRSKLAEATYARPPGAFGNDFDRFFTRQAALMGLMMNPFRPEHEHEADCAAATWLFQEGYDPAALGRFLERMGRRQGEAPANPFFDFTRSHPDTRERREHVAARLRQLRRWDAGRELGLYPDRLQELRSKFARPADPDAG